MASSKKSGWFIWGIVSIVIVVIGLILFTKLKAKNVKIAYYTKLINGVKVQTRIWPIMTVFMSILLISISVLIMLNKCDNKITLITSYISLGLGILFLLSSLYAHSKKMMVVRNELSNYYTLAKQKYGCRQLKDKFSNNFNKLNKTKCDGKLN